MKNIFGFLAAFALIVMSSPSASAEDEIKVSKGEGTAHVEFDASGCKSKWGFYRCSASIREEAAAKAKDESYAKAIDDAKKEAQADCKWQGERRGKFGKLEANMAEKWVGTTGSCMEKVDLMTGKHAFDCKANVRSRCMIVENDPRQKEDQALKAKVLKDEVAPAAAEAPAAAVAAAKQ